MKRYLSILLILFVAILITGMVSEKKRPVKVFLASDSTCANYELEDDYQSKRFPLIGWGQVFQQYFRKKGQDFVSEKYFMNLPAQVYSAYPDGQKDHTHFQPAGANAVAQLVFDGLISLKLKK